MNSKNNVTRDEIADTIHREFGFSRNECLDIVNDIIDIIVNGLNDNGIVKIHNFGTFKVRKKNSRIGRNPKTKEEYIINNRSVVSFKASKILLKQINSKNLNEKIS